MLDSLIIGAGPAGLAVANSFAKAGIDYLVVEKGSIGDHISQYPTFMQFFSTRDLVEIDGFPLNIIDEKPSRRQYLNYLTRFVQDRGINVRTLARVVGVEKAPEGHFEVMLEKRDGSRDTIETHTVVVACGAFENPRSLGAAGEELSKVTHFFKEPHPYVDNSVLVVGGRNSAIETALLLWRAGAKVSLSYRKPALNGYGIKYWLLPDIENRLKNNEITGYLGTEVKRIDWETVTLVDQQGKEQTIANDYVVCQTGYNPPVQFLRGIGIDVEENTNLPKHDAETLETNIPGIFIAGTIIAGNVSGKVFIENSRHHGEMILRGLRERLKSVAAV